MKNRAIYLVAALIVCLLPHAGFAFELHPQLGHTDAVQSIAFSPDGKYVISGGLSTTMKLWEMSSGKELRDFSVKVEALAYSPDGKYIASATSHTARLWEVSSGKEIYSFTNTDSVRAVTFSPDGKYLASAGWDNTVHLWEVSSGTEIRFFEGHRSWIKAVAFSPDGQYLASGSADKTVKLWEVSSGKEIRSFTDHNFGIQTVTFSPDGKYLASASGDINSKDSEKTVKLWEFSSGKEIRSFEGHTGVVKMTAFSPDGKYLVSSGYDNQVRLWEVDSGKQIRSFLGHTVAISSDGKYLVSSGYSYDNIMKRWEFASGKELRTIKGHISSIQAVAYSPDGKYLASAIFGRTIRLLEINSGKPIRSLSLPIDWIFREGVHAMTYSPDGKYLAYAKALNVSLWEVSSSNDKIRSFTDHKSIFTAIAFSPDGLYLAGASNDKTVKLWEVSTGKEIRSFTGHTGSVLAVAFSPDGKYLASASGYDKTLRLWEVSSGKEIYSLTEQGGMSSSVAFSPDGKYLASAGGFGGTVRLWEVVSGKEHLSITTGFNSIAFSPDGNTLASGSRLWEISSGKELPSLSPGGSLIAFSSDGKYLASGGSDGTTRLRRIDTGDSMVMVSSSEGEWLLYTDDGLFDSSPGGLDLIAAVDGMHGYNVDQLALKNNRPDLILKRMGLGTPELIDYYYKRYLNRLKKAKIDEAKLDGAFQNLPQSTITETTLSSSGQDVEISLALEDQAGLKSYQVYVNGVALYEGFGKEVSGTKQTLKETIALTEGENRIEVSALNVGGQESFRALAVVAGSAKLNKDLYFVGFGVSDYTDKNIPDLTYANKDAKELSLAFSKLQGYDNRFVKTYTDKQVTKASIVEAKKFFKKARSQDTVVLFIAGHGLHDNDELATYYYILHGTQPNKMAETAASFEEIEGLLSGIDAKQKLFLMDTCESGEREDAVEQITLAGAKSRGLDARAITLKKVAATQKKTPEQSIARPWLLERDRYIYQDLAKRTGAIVFSSSKGNEFSYESTKLQNGLFTEAILEGLSKKAADENKDGQISTDELRKYVSQNVATLSGNLQHPTVDRDNLSLHLFFVP